MAAVPVPVGPPVGVGLPVGLPDGVMREMLKYVDERSLAYVSMTTKRILKNQQENPIPEEYLIRLAAAALSFRRKVLREKVCIELKGKFKLQRASRERDAIHIRILELQRASRERQAVHEQDMQRLRRSFNRAARRLQFAERQRYLEAAREKDNLRRERREIKSKLDILYDEQKTCLMIVLMGLVVLAMVIADYIDNATIHLREENERLKSLLGDTDGGDGGIGRGALHGGGIALITRHACEFVVEIIFLGKRPQPIYDKLTSTLISLVIVTRRRRMRRSLSGRRAPALKQVT